MRQLRRAAGAVPRQWLRPGLAEGRPTIARSYREYSRGRAATDSPGTLLPPLLCLVPFLNRSISNLVRPDFHNGRSDKVLLRHLIKMLPVVLLVAQSFHPFSPGLPRAPAVIAATRATAPVMLEEFRENMFNKLEAYEKRVAKRTFAGFVAGAVGAGVIGLLSMSGVPANADVNTIGADVVTQAVELSKTQKVVAEKAEQVAKIALEKVAAAEAAEKLAAERLAAAEMAYATKLHSNEAAYATQLSSMSGTVKDLEAEQAALKQKLADKLAEKEAQRSEAQSALEKKVAEKKAQLAQAKASVAQASLETREAEKEAESQEAQAQEGQAQEAQAALQKTVGEKEVQLAAAQEELRKYQEEKASLVAAQTALEARVAETEAHSSQEKAALLAQVAEKEAQLAAAQEELMKVKEEKASLVAAQTTLEARVATTEAQSAQAQEALLEQVAEKEAQLEEVQAALEMRVNAKEAELAEVRLALEKLFAESAASLETARAPLEAALADAKQAETVARGRETAARQQAEEALKQAAAARQQAGLAVQAASSVVKTAAKVGPVDWKDTSTQIITALSVLAAGQAWMAVSGRSPASATEGKPPPRENPNYIREAFEETLGGGAPPGELTRGAWALGRLPSAQPRPAASPAWSAPVGQAPAQAWSASAQAPGQWKSLRAAPLKRDALTIFFEGLENLKLDSLGWWQGRGLPSPLTSTAPTATVTSGQQVPQDGYAPQQSSTATAAAWTTAKESAERLLARDAAAERAAAAASWSNEALSWSPQEAAQQAWRAMQQAPQGTGAPLRADPYAETTQQAWRNVQQAPAQYQALAPYQAPAPSATIAPGSADGMRFRPLRASPATRTAAPPIFEARRQPSPAPRGVVTKTRRGDRASKVLLTRAGQPKRALPRPAGQEVLGPRPPKNALWRAAERAQQVEPAQPGQGWW